MKTIGVFGDRFSLSTGMAVVLTNIADELSRYFHVMYFGRFGQEEGFSKEPTVISGHHFENVDCEGGVWDRELVIRILKHYKEVDLVVCEDDWYSMNGMVGACTFWDKPLHLISPIDSLPVHPLAFNEVFTMCDAIYIPNSSYKIFHGRKRLNSPYVDKVKERTGPTLDAVFLPHGVDGQIFYPKRVEREDKFTFLWIGRPEQRKAPGRVILAWERVCDRMDALLYLRTDLGSPGGQRIIDYVTRKNLPIILDQMTDCPQSEMVDVYNRGDINISTSMAGAHEMSITESAACGLSSIVTDFPFMNENVVAGKSGFLVPVSEFTHPYPYYNPLAKDRIWGKISIEKLADTMYSSYMNQELVRHMGRWAREYVLENYNWKDVGKRLKEEVNKSIQ